MNPHTKFGGDRQMDMAVDADYEYTYMYLGVRYALFILLRTFILHKLNRPFSTFLKYRV